VRTLLIVDDDLGTRNILQSALKDHFDVRAVDSGAAALRELARGAYDVVLCDISMNGMTGLEVLCRIGECWPGTRVVMMSAIEECYTVVEAMSLGACNFVVKEDWQSFKTLIQVLNTAAAVRQKDDAQMLSRSAAEAQLTPVSAVDMEDAQPAGRSTARTGAVATFMSWLMGLEYCSHEITRVVQRDSGELHLRCSLCEARV
jgi:DNA-binding NtrC family response regulator